MLYSGVDWSGSPGAGHGPWLVFAMAHIEGADFPAVDAALAQVRKKLRVDTDFVFHFSDASDRTKSEFFAAFPCLPVYVRVHMMSKAGWSATYVKGSTGTDCICDGIVHLISRCPRECVEDQILYVDLNPDEKANVTRYRTTLRKALKIARQPSFKDMKARPDDRNDGAIIQVADMVAGEVRKRSGLAGPYLPNLRNMIEIV